MVIRVRMVAADSIPGLVARLGECICAGELRLAADDPPLSSRAAWPQLRKHLLASAYTHLLDLAEVPYATCMDGEGRDRHNAMLLAKVQLCMCEAGTPQVLQVDTLWSQLLGCSSVLLPSEDTGGSREADTCTLNLTEHSRLLSLLLALSPAAAQQNTQPTSTTTRSVAHAPSPQVQGHAWLRSLRPSVDTQSQIWSQGYLPPGRSDTAAQPCADSWTRHADALGLWGALDTLGPTLDLRQDSTSGGTGQHSDPAARLQQLLESMSQRPPTSALLHEPTDQAALLADGLCQLRLLQSPNKTAGQDSPGLSRHVAADHPPQTAGASFLTHLPGVADMDAEPGQWTLFYSAEDFPASAAHATQGQGDPATPSAPPPLAPLLPLAFTADHRQSGAWRPTQRDDGEGAARAGDILTMVLLALQGTVSAIHALKHSSLPENPRCGVRRMAQSQVLSRLLQCAEYRVRLEAFLQAHDPPVLQSDTHDTDPSSVSLAAFLCCVRQLVCGYDEAIQGFEQLLAASQPPAASVQHMTLFELSVQVEPLMSQLGLLAGACMCTPCTAQSRVGAARRLTTSGMLSRDLAAWLSQRASLAPAAMAWVSQLHAEVLQGGLGLPLSLWMVQPFPSGRQLLDSLYNGLMQADAASMDLLQQLLVAASAPYLQQLSHWTFATPTGRSDAWASHTPGQPPSLPLFLSSLQHEIHQAGRQQHLLKQLQPQIGTLADRLSHIWARMSAHSPLAAGQEPQQQSFPRPLSLVFTTRQLQQVSEACQSAHQSGRQEVDRTLDLLSRRRHAAQVITDMEAVARAQEYELQQEMARQEKEAQAAAARQQRSALLVAHKSEMEVAERVRREEREQRILEEQQLLMSAVMKEHAEALAVLRDELLKSASTAASQSSAGPTGGRGAGEAARRPALAGAAAATGRGTDRHAAPSLANLTARAKWRMQRLALSEQRLALLEGVEAQELQQLRDLVAAGRPHPDTLPTPVSSQPPQQPQTQPQQPSVNLPIPAAAPPTPQALLQQALHSRSDEHLLADTAASVQQPGLTQGSEDSEQPSAGAGGHRGSVQTPAARAGVPISQDTAPHAGDDSSAGMQQRADRDRDQRTGARKKWGSAHDSPPILGHDRLQQATGRQQAQARARLHDGEQDATQRSVGRVMQPVPSRRRAWGPAPAPVWQAGLGQGPHRYHHTGLEHDTDHSQESLEDRASMTSVIEVCVALPVLWQYRLTSVAVWRLMAEELGLVQMTQTLRRYFFFEAGDVAQHLLEGLLHRWRPWGALSSRPSPDDLMQQATGTGARQQQGGTAHSQDALGQVPGFVGRQQLAAALSEALASCPASRADPDTSLLHVTLAAPDRDVYQYRGSAGGQQQLGAATAAAVHMHGLGAAGSSNAFTLTGQLPWPVSEVLCGDDARPSDMQQGGPGAGQGVQGWDPRSAPPQRHNLPVPQTYSDIASALLRIRLCLAALHTAWLAVGKPTATQRRRTASTYEPASRATQLSAVRGWVHEAMHFMSALNRHASHSLLGSCWQQLERSLLSHGPLDLSQMRGVHDEYLAHAAACCFLTQPPPSSSSTQHAAPPHGPGTWGATGGVTSGASSVSASEVLQQAVVRAMVWCEAVAGTALTYLESVELGTGLGEEDGEEWMRQQEVQGFWFAEAQTAHHTCRQMVSRVHGLLPHGAGRTSSGGGGSAEGGAGARSGGRQQAMAQYAVGASLLAELDCDWYRRRV